MDSEKPIPNAGKLWSKTLIALMCVNFINVLVFYLLMVELVGYSTSTYGVSKTLAALPNTTYIISCIAALAFFCYSGVGSFVVGYAEAEQFTTISVFFLLYSVVIVALRPFAGKRVDRSGENSIIYFTLASLVIGLLMIALAPNGAVFLLAAAFLGIGVGVTQSVAQAVVAREAPAAEQGRANSTFMMGLDVGSGFGPMVLGAVLELLTYREMYLALSVVAVLTIVIYYLVHGRYAARSAPRS